MATINTVGVIGAGQMGAGIAQVSAMTGLKTIVWDLNQEALAKAIKSIAGFLDKMVEKGKLTAAQAESAKGNLIPVKTLKELADCDLVVEAATENFDIKAKIFAELDAVTKASAILTSNTSSISITKIAATTKRPSQVMGMHFMNPVPLMKLVELIRGIQTSDATFKAVQEMVQKMGKTGVEAKDSPGFTVNRVLMPMINEAIFLLQEGTKPKDIDDGMVLGTNQPMGPLALADLIGLDTCLFIMQVLHRELGEDKYRPCPLLVKYVEAGWFGRKTKKGFYTYD
jgi:3-hydroxybutyryl-CoA dehydrogenase